MSIIKKYPLYQKIILNNFISTLGDSMYYIALMTYAAQFTNSSLAITIVSLSESIPFIFASPLGSVADMSENKATKIFYSGLIRGVLYLSVGVLIGFQQSMMLLVGISLINFISDNVGKFSNSLFYPFVPLIVEQDDLEEAQGLNGAISNIVAIIAQFVGAYLLGLFSYQLLAVINSMTFFATALIVLSMKKSLDTLEKEHLDKRESISLSAIWKQMVFAIKETTKNKQFFKLILVFAGLNGLSSAISPLLSIILAKDSALIVDSFSFTFALIQGLTSIGVILGSLFGTKLFKKLELEQFTQLILFFMALLVCSILLKTIYLLLGFQFILGLLIGILNPKFNAKLMKEIPLDKLATIAGGVSTLLMFFPPITIFIFTTVATVFSSNISLIALSISCLLLCFYSFISGPNTKKI
ncbi:hypothetical protein BW731_04490 [Vagococcus martis]|uniref:MFS transporter n=1 Tax=Vagococcus martis TaxID=1768210 RepID=A0A1V4DGE7_9ENTE|nr:MFS transporter [Vagococcus martis]OPF87511.1 hypothetical protein BW731_04490 [Vagococcus martis]